MAASSTMLELGTPLPSFGLPDVTTGEVVSSTRFAGSVAVVLFICNHCPYVKHIRDELAAFGRHCATNGVKIVAVSSNDVTTHPEDGPDAMALEARDAGYTFPYLYDKTQEVAKSFRAACTPEVYVFDVHGNLAYRGRFDESTPKNGKPVSGRDAREAVDALLDGRAPHAEQSPSIGCSIKWKPGNEPDWLR